jgi:hypothetical protein
MTIDEVKHSLGLYVNAWRARLLKLTKQVFTSDSLRVEISRRYLRGIGVDIGPLNVPFISSGHYQILRVDISQRETC